jgi:hypothetical protein
MLLVCLVVRSKVVVDSSGPCDGNQSYGLCCILLKVAHQRPEGVSLMVRSTQASIYVFVDKRTGFILSVEQLKEVLLISASRRKCKEHTRFGGCQC